MRVVGYVRVSTEEQATDGVSLAAQRAKLAAYASLYDLEVVAIVEDAGVSAKTLDRPGLSKVLAMVAAGEVEGVLVAKLDRLVLNILGSVAQWEREAIGERTSAALQHKRSRGELVGGVPYGFRVAADGVMLEADAGEQEVITVARELVAGGLSLRKVAAGLAARGYAPRSGGEFHAQQIKRMVAA
jgi:site-specific DNA recombinase